MWVRVPALLCGVHREEQGEGAIQAREGASQLDFTPGKTISPQVLALGRGDNAGEGNVGRGVEGEESLAKVP